MIYVIATMSVKPEMRDDFMSNARDVVAATRREAGCISYDLTNSTSEPNEFVFVERWESREHLEAHFRTPHLLHWRDLCEGYVAARRVEIIKPDGVDIV